MKVLLLVACFAALAWSSHGAPAQETEELLSILKKLENSLEKRDSLEKRGADLHELVFAAVSSAAPEYIDAPVFEAPQKVLKSVLEGILEAVFTDVPEEKSVLSLARMARAFIHVLVQKGINHVYEVADSVYNTLGELEGVGDDLAELLDRRGLDDHEVAAAAAAGTTGEEDEFWHAIQDHLIFPNTDVLQEIDGMFEGIDEADSANIFQRLKNLAEEEGLLSRPLKEAALEIAQEISNTIIYAEPIGEVPSDLLERVLNRIQEWIDIVEGLTVEDCDDHDLPEEKKQLVRTVISTILPLIEEYIQPAKTLIKRTRNDPFRLIPFFSKIIKRVLGDNYRELKSIVPAVREGAKIKSDVIERLVDAVADGRGEEMFTALFTEIISGAVGVGADLDEIMGWAGDVLDRVDVILSEDNEPEV